MSELIGFKTADGAPVVVELAASDEAGFERVRRKPGELVVQAQEGFENALSVIRTTADSVVGQIAGLATRPDEVGVEFGLKLTLKAGAVIASTEGEAHIQVSLTWRNPSSPGH
jgi:hypothetical protein